MSNGRFRAPPLERELRVAAMLLAAGLVAFSATFSALAPGGSWNNKIFGERAWTEDDPGGFYVASAHELAWGEAPLFEGHPGTTLAVMLRAVQSVSHALGAEPEVSFARFTVQHLPLVYWLSKLMMTGLHLLSFAALYALALALLRDRRAAMLAVLGYASSLPVLYFLSRISVEPLMVLLLAFSFLCFWRAQDAGRGDSRLAQYGWITLCAFSAASGAMTKLSFLGALPCYLALLVALEPSCGEGLRRRAQSVALFGAVASATIFFYSHWIDWAAFGGVWGSAAEDPYRRAWTLAALVPGLGPGRIFVPAELPFCIVSGIGVVAYLRSRPAELRRALGFAVFVALATCLWVYRVVAEGSFLPFHYFFITQAGLAVGFGFGASLALRRFGLSPMYGLAMLAILHALAAVAVVDARRHDARVYSDRRPVLDAVAELGPDDRVGVVLQGAVELPPDHKLWAVHGFIFPVFFGPRRSVLRDEFESLLVPLPESAVAPELPRVRMPLWHAELVVLRDHAREREAPSR